MVRRNCLPLGGSQLRPAVPATGSSCARSTVCVHMYFGRRPTVSKTFAVERRSRSADEGCAWAHATTVQIITARSRRIGGLMGQEY